MTNENVAKTRKDIQSQIRKDKVRKRKKEKKEKNKRIDREKIHVIKKDRHRNLF